MFNSLQKKTDNTKEKIPPKENKKIIRKNNSKIMKKIVSIFDKSSMIKRAMMIMTIFFLTLAGTSAVKAQTIYQTVAWDNYTAFTNVPVCPCDSIKCVPPAGATGISWFASGAPETYRGDTLILASGFNGQVTCFNSHGTKSLYLRPTLLPASPGFPVSDTVCGMETITLSALNPNQYGFNTYTWYTGSAVQTITEGAGLHWVRISNVCGYVYDSITIVEHNFNHPNLGQDVTTCQGDIVTLDPGIGYSAYLWLPGNSIDSTLSPTTSGTYIVQTTNTVGGCIDKDTVVINFIAPLNQDIDLVTIDTSNGNNRITWLANQPAGRYVKIYRELTSNNYISVGSESYVTGTFTDTVNSRNRAWRYKIGIIDSCGNEGALSHYVQSIHSWVTATIGGGYTVQWTPYMVETKTVAVSQYNIYNGSDLGYLNYLTFVPGSVTVYSMLTFDDSIYVIGAELSGKSFTDDALSNWVSKNDAIGISENNVHGFSISPNPATDYITIQSRESITVSISDLVGRIILITQEKKICVSKIPCGIYIIAVNNKSGQYSFKRFMKL